MMRRFKEDDPMARNPRRSLGGASVQDLVEGGQQLVSDAQGRAEDTAKLLRDTLAGAVSTLEKRRDVELKNLRARLRDINTNMGGLERRYRALEKRLTRQVESLSGRAVKACDLDKRLRLLEGEIRRVAGRATGASPARRAPSRSRTTAAARKAAPARKKAAARKTTAARKPAAARKTTAARRTTATRKPAATRRKAAPKKTAGS
jgi:hypothetical protein